MVLWFVTIAALGVVVDRAGAGRAGGVRPAACGDLLRDQRLHGIRGARRGVPRRHRRRSALRRHGALRQASRSASRGSRLVLPALVLNYLGQGALLLLEARRSSTRSSCSRPSWALLPLVALATAAAIIASQALISGVVLDHAPGHPARTRAPPRRRAHVGARDGPDLRAAGELGADGRDAASS